MNSKKIGFAAVLFFLTGSDVHIGSSAGAAGVVHVKNDRGGVVVDYALRVLQFKKAGTAVNVSGSCMSACTLFLSLPVEQVCVTQEASFGFHLPYGMSARSNRIAKHYLYGSYPEWVKAWLKQHGGLARTMKVMSYDVARRHIRPCSQTVSASGAVAEVGGPAVVASSIY